MAAKDLITEKLREDVYGDNGVHILKVLDVVRVLEVEGLQIRKIPTKQTAAFLGGGHHYVETFLPESDVVIGDEVSRDKLEQVATIAHEMIERLLMKFLGYNYDKAHAIADVVYEAVLHGKELPGEPSRW